MKFSKHDFLYFCYTSYSRVANPSQLQLNWSCKRYLNKIKQDIKMESSSILTNTKTDNLKIYCVSFLRSSVRLWSRSNLKRL